jgi:hypothetical protein
MLGRQVTRPPNGFVLTVGFGSCQDLSAPTGRPRRAAYVGTRTFQRSSNWSDQDPTPARRTTALVALPLTQSLTNPVGPAGPVRASGLVVARAVSIEASGLSMAWKR